MVHERVELVAHVCTLLGNVDGLHRSVPFIVILALEDQET